MSRPRNVASFGVSRCLFSSIVFFPDFSKKKEQCLAHPVSLSRSERDTIIPLYFLIQHFYFIKKDSRTAPDWCWKCSNIQYTISDYSISIGVKSEY